MTIKRSCHGAEEKTQADPVTATFFFFFPKRPACVHVFTGGAHSKAVLIPR